MLQPKTPLPQPFITYTLENKADSRATLLKTVKKVLEQPEKDVFLDIEVRFRHRDVFTTNVVSSVTLTKGPQEKTAEESDPQLLRKVRRQENKRTTKKKLKEIAKRQSGVNKAKKPKKMQKAVVRQIPTGEFYAVHNWTESPRVQLVEEEHAVYEAGEQEDATVNDTRSSDSGLSQQSGGSDKTLQEKIREWEEGPLPIELNKQPSGAKKDTTQVKAETPPTAVPAEQPKEEAVTTAVQTIVESTSKKEELAAALIAQPKEEAQAITTAIQTSPPPKKTEVLAPVQQQEEKKPLVAAEAQTPPPVPAAGRLDMKPGANGKTEVLLTVRAHRKG